MKAEKIASCNVFLRKKDILVATSARTIPGFEIIVAPVFKLRTDETPAALGQAVLDALSSYLVNVEPPGPNMNDLPNPLLKIAGCKNWGQLDRSSLNVFVTRYPDHVLVIPTRREPNRGAVHLPEQAISCEVSPAVVGDAVARAAALSS